MSATKPAFDPVLFAAIQEGIDKYLAKNDPDNAYSRLLLAFDRTDQVAVWQMLETIVELSEASQLPPSLVAIILLKRVGQDRLNEVTTIKDVHLLFGEAIFSEESLPKFVAEIEAHWASRDPIPADFSLLTKVHETLAQQLAH